MEYWTGSKRSEQKNECRKCAKPGPGKCKHGVACWFQHRCWYIDSHTTAEKEMWAAEERTQRTRRPTGVRTTKRNKGGGEVVARSDGRATAAATVKAAKAQSDMAGRRSLMSGAGDEVNEAESGDGKERRVEQRAHAR